jgi:hypothetical protein
MSDIGPDGSVLYGYRDIAAELGIGEGTLRNYRRRGYMPPPDVMLADRPRWRWDTVQQWRHERLVGANTARSA